MAEGMYKNALYIRVFSENVYTIVAQYILYEYADHKIHSTILN